MNKNLFITAWSRLKAASRHLIAGDRSPKVGLGVVVVRNNTILIGKRKGSHCAGQLCLPGGHLEYGEEIAAGGEREVLEESGLVVKIRPFDACHIEWCLVNNILEGKHYVGLFLVADWTGGEPAVLEPHKNEFWTWLDYDHVLSLGRPGCAWLPTELFQFHRSRILNKVTSVN